MISIICISPQILFGSENDGRSDGRGHVAPLSEKINAHRVLMGTPEETDCLEDLFVDWILLKWLINKQYVKAWTTSSTG